MNQVPEKPKYAMAIKGMIIFLLILVLVIPTILINELIRERQIRLETAVKEVSSKWADAQTITGPIITIPYLEYYRDSLGVHSYKRNAHVLPDRLNIDGSLLPEMRYRGIYEVVVYNSKMNFKGTFDDLSLKALKIPEQNILWDEAVVSIGISDLRGIEDEIVYNWNGKDYSFNSGLENKDVLYSGINARINILHGDSAKPNTFSFALNLKGSEHVYFSPIGKTTELNITSPWSTPSFDGAFLPDKRDVGPEGFKAFWRILHLNRNFPQQWTNNQHNIEGSAFGINLKIPTDNYTKTDRSMKYSILFIALTFLIFYFLELLNNKNIHALQYLLVGFALCIFYVLLLSISEHIKYNFAYLIASIMTIGLITWYTAGVLKDRKLSGMICGNLCLLYGFIFCLIQLEDYALLMGSLGLFIILCVVMFFSRKIDWNTIMKK
jgi:inner membrane protein